MQEARAGQRRRIDLPQYPKAFVAAARLAKERDRVFVAMPFEDEHPRILWRVIQGVCNIRGLNLRRADSSSYPDLIVADILEEIERAEIVVADLTGLNPNVLYELGIAHVRCDSVILLCQKGQRLPFDLASFRVIFFDFSSIDGQVAFADRLGRTLDEIRVIGPPTTTQSVLERTRLVISDLQTLASRPDDELSREVVWYSGFLSSFAISAEEPFPPEEEEYQKALMQEKDSLLALARRGCVIRCIITPPSPDALLRGKLDIAYCRVKALLQFLMSHDETLKNIEWAVSPFRQKSLYLIGHVSLYEGYKRGFQRGFGLTLRQTGLDAINACISLYEVLFEYQSTYTLANFGVGELDDRREALRLSTIKCLEGSLEFLRSILERERPEASATCGTADDPLQAARKMDIPEQPDENSRQQQNRLRRNHG